MLRACQSHFYVVPGAARDGKLQQLRTLVAEGWSLATRDQHGSNALLWAAGGTRWLAACCAWKLHDSPIIHHIRHNMPQ